VGDAHPYIGTTIEAYKFLNPYSQQLEYVVVTVSIPIGVDNHGADENLHGTRAPQLNYNQGSSTMGGSWPTPIHLRGADPQYRPNHLLSSSDWMPATSLAGDFGADERNGYIVGPSSSAVTASGNARWQGGDEEWNASSHQLEHWQNDYLS